MARYEKAARARDLEGFKATNLEAVTRVQQAAKDGDSEAFSAAILEAVNKS